MQREKSGRFTQAESFLRAKNGSGGSGVVPRAVAGVSETTPFPCSLRLPPPFPPPARFRRRPTRDRRRDRSGAIPGGGASPLTRTRTTGVPCCRCRPSARHAPPRLLLKAAIQFAHSFRLAVHHVLQGRNRLKGRITAAEGHHDRPGERRLADAGLAQLLRHSAAGRRGQESQSTPGPRARRRWPAEGPYSAAGS